MNCLDYSCPIIIPQGLRGPAGASAPGSVGANILVNSIATPVTSASTGDQSLVSSTLTAGLPSAGDILEFEAYLSANANTYAGTVSIYFGTQVLLSYTWALSHIFIPPANSLNYFVLKSKVLFKTTATESYVGSIELLENGITTIPVPIANCAQDSSGALILNLRCNPSAGAITCNYFTVTLIKKS